MNIFCAGFGTLVPVFKALGHNVLWVDHKNFGLLNVPKHLASHNFKADVVMQSENLGPRLLLEGLEELSVPKIFWAIDSHLNMHWHQYYARLFTALLTPHLSLWQALPQGKKHPLAIHFTRHGYDLPFLPHAQRQNELSFVGILDKHRPLRLQMCNLLSAKFPSFNVQQGISAEEMLKLYGNSRIVPNESIAFEVNYRLLEAASAGAAVLTPDIGEDQDALLARDREMLVYDHAAHLMELAEELWQFPQKSGELGFAAWKRVQASHLPRHRGEFVLHLAEALLKGKTPHEHSQKSKQFYVGSTEALGSGGAFDFWLARVQSKRADLAGQENVPLPPELPELLELPESPCLAESAKWARLANLAGRGPCDGGGVKECRCDCAESGKGGKKGEVLSFVLRLLLEHGQRSAPISLMEEILVEERFEESTELNLVCAAGALRLENFDFAKQFFYRQQKAVGATSLPPQTYGELCLAFAKILNKLKMYAQPGFTFNHKRHLPSSAFELLVLVEDDYRKDVNEAELLEIADSAVASLKGMAFFHMGYLARLCIARPDDWRTQLKYGLLNLLCYRLEEGLFEIESAGQKAQEKNEKPAFLRVLKAHDKAGAALRAIGREHQAV